jgi:hypothetical protein
MFEKNLPEVVSPEEWLAARKELLACSTYSRAASSW